MLGELVLQALDLFIFGLLHDLREVADLGTRGLRCTDHLAVRVIHGIQVLLLLMEGGLQGHAELVHLGYQFLVILTQLRYLGLRCRVAAIVALARLTGVEDQIYVKINFDALPF